MPFKYELTWISHAKRWRKRYRGRTYYMKTNVGGKTDREGYLAALEEWHRLKDFLDGFGPDPYTTTGVLIPKELVTTFAPRNVQSIGVAALPTIENATNDPHWILSRGIGPFLHPELIVSAPAPVKSGEERRISVLSENYLAFRRQEVERGNLSLKQWDEDRHQVETFRNFLSANYAECVFIDQLSPAMLNTYRDKQSELCKSNITLKKRLEGVRKWLSWLIDRNVLTTLPKDMTTYAKVRLDKPKPTFFSVEEVRSIYGQANDLLKACILLGLNAGFTQRDCATLTVDMIDWKQGTLSRDRSKTGQDQKAKLWPETIAQLRKVGHFDRGGALLRNVNGKLLVYETQGPNGKIVTTDSVRKMWGRLKSNAGKSFKHLRKTSANYIESWNPSLTGLFLAHAEGGVKRHYVTRHYEELFALTDRLRDVYKLTT